MNPHLTERVLLVLVLAAVALRQRIINATNDIRRGWNSS